MKELKRLKDLEYDKNRLFTDEVKKEAIKWVKAFREENCDVPFIEFFNITEEDLK